MNAAADRGFFQELICFDIYYSFFNSDIGQKYYFSCSINNLTNMWYYLYATFVSLRRSEDNSIVTDQGVTIRDLPSEFILIIDNRAPSMITLSSLSLLITSLEHSNIRVEEVMFVGCVYAIANIKIYIRRR